MYTSLKLKFWDCFRLEPWPGPWPRHDMDLDLDLELDNYQLSATLIRFLHYILIKMEHLYFVLYIEEFYIYIFNFGAKDFFVLFLRWMHDDATDHLLKRRRVIVHDFVWQVLFCVPAFTAVSVGSVQSVTVSHQVSPVQPVTLVPYSE